MQLCHVKIWTLTLYCVLLLLGISEMHPYLSGLFTSTRVDIRLVKLQNNYPEEYGKDKLVDIHISLNFGKRLSCQISERLNILKTDLISCLRNFARSYDKTAYVILKRSQGPIMVTWFNFNPSMDK